MSPIVPGVIRGKTIELEEDPGFTDGEERPANKRQIPCASTLSQHDGPAGFGLQPPLAFAVANDAQVFDWQGTLQKGAVKNKTVEVTDEPLYVEQGKKP